MDMVTYRLLTKGFMSLASFLRSISRYATWLMSVVVMIPSMRTCSSVRWLICEMSSNNLLFDSLSTVFGVSLAVMHTNRNNPIVLVLS